MEKLLEILESVKPGVDFKNEVGLVENGIIDSFDVVTLISLISQDKISIALSLYHQYVCKGIKLCAI